MADCRERERECKRRAVLWKVYHRLMRQVCTDCTCQQRASGRDVRVRIKDGCLGFGILIISFKLKLYV